MYHQFKQAIAPPQFEDENKTLTASLLNTTLLVLIGATIIVPFLLYIAEPTQEAAFIMIVGVITALIFGGLLRLMHRGRIELVGTLFSTFFFLIVTLNTITFGILNSATSGFILVIILSIFFIRSRHTAVIFTTLSILALTGIYIAQIQGWIQGVEPRATPTIIDLIIYITIFTITGSLLRFSVRNLNDALDRARASERAAATANNQLKDFNADLENIVAVRTQALVTSAEIGRSISTILEQKQLVKEVADQIREAFDYYQVHVYILNESGDTLNLAAGSGVAGGELVAKNHFVPISKGLVGRTARMNIPVLEPNVQEAPEWLPNPLLPDTRSEATVPISIGNTVLGVLDIQQNKVNALDQSDIGLLGSISGQVAIALQNARLLTEAQENARQEALINEISQNIQSATTVDLAMQIAVREIGRAVNAQQTRIRLGTAPLSHPDKESNGRTSTSDRSAEIDVKPKD